jgi:hypothetical protein
MTAPTGEVAQALRVVAALLGDEGCCCKPRDRQRVPGGHTVACDRARRFLARHGVDVDRGPPSA